MIARQGPYHRWLGRDVAANGNLPLRMVASPAQGPSVSEAEPNACGSAQTSIARVSCVSAT